MNGLSSVVLGAHPMVRDGADLSAALPTGAWMNDPEGRLVPGSLGFVVDHVTAWAIVDGVPAERTTSVSADILIDFLRPFPVDGSLLTTRGHLVHADSLGALAAGETVDASGQLIATVRQRGRWVPIPERIGQRGEAGFSPEVVGLASRSPSIDAFLGATRTPNADGAVVAFPVSEQVQNGLGILHGGASIVGADLAAATALAGAPLATSSIHVNYLRPTPAGDVATFTATVVHRGRTVAVVRVVGSAAHGKPCTITTVTASAAPAPPPQ